jgi:hypothetical protein
MTIPHPAFTLSSHAPDSDKPSPASAVASTRNSQSVPDASSPHPASSDGFTSTPFAEFIRIPHPALTFTVHDPDSDKPSPANTVASTCSSHPVPDASSPHPASSDGLTFKLFAAFTTSPHPALTFSLQSPDSDNASPASSDASTCS